MAKKTILYVDGENFMFSVAKVLKANNVIRHKSEITRISIRSIIDVSLKAFSVDEAKFYAGKISIPKHIPELQAKSHTLAESQRRLKRYLENEGAEFIMSGHVRFQETVIGKHGELQGIFKEKGTDVKIAIDMVSNACDGLTSTALLLSLDSDMQPAVKELARRGVKVIYVGFEKSINRGLSQTTGQTVLIRADEILDAWSAANS